MLVVAKPACGDLVRPRWGCMPFHRELAHPLAHGALVEHDPLAVERLARIPSSCRFPEWDFEIGIVHPQQHQHAMPERHCTAMDVQRVGALGLYGNRARVHR
jgi:hypothetical protein